MRCAQRFLPLVVVLAWTAPATAKVAMPDGSPLPETPLVDEVAHGPWLVWVACEGCRPRELPADDAPEVARGQPLRFLEPCYCAARHPKAGARFALLARLDDDRKRVREHLGWVEERSLVMEPHAVLDDSTRIHRKALVVNSVAALRSGGAVEPVAPRLAPRADAARGEALRPLQIFFVYGDVGDRDGYVLLGARPSWNSAEPEEARRVVLGWVPKARVCLWNTREAFTWDTASTLPDAVPRRLTPGQVYATRADARKGLRDAAVPCLFREPFDERGVSPAPGAHGTRYPILEKADQAGTNLLLKVGMSGGFHGADGRVVASAQEVETIQRKLAVLQRQVSRTEVLFVIDDTESMDSWFPTVARVVDHIVADVRKTPERKVRFAITYYNDTEDGKTYLDKAVETNPLADAASSAAGAMVKELREHKVRPGYDPREQVFLGITRAIEDAGFEAHSRKIVIVIGDMADHADENDPKHPGENKIVSRLAPEGQSPIEFYAIQVIEPDRDPDARAFRAQMRTILELLRRKVGDEQFGSYVSLGDKDTLRRDILARYKRLNDQADELSRQVDALARGKWKTEMAPELEALLKRYGIDLDRLRAQPGPRSPSWGHPVPARRRC
jgi:hypothetical protein